VPRCRRSSQPSTRTAGPGSRRARGGSRRRIRGSWRIAAAVGHEEWQRWPADPPRDEEAARRFIVEQLVAHEQHEGLRAAARAAGLRLYGDAQIGLGHRDRFAFASLLLRGYALGAPPSRTNPDGQPWGYGVFDPRQLEPGGAARSFVAERFDLLLTRYDGLRLDHPHGWVCPWVYQGDDVRGGARLHESPDLPDHPRLAKHARVRGDQLDRSLPRHHDYWVSTIEPAQVEAYATVVDLIVERVRARGLALADVIAEVLSTCPLPLHEVLKRHSLGRFRITQKARVDDPTDGYLGENAAPADWIMIGNHDTPALRALVDRWTGGADEEAARRAGYLATRLRRDAAELTRPAALAQAMLADLFLGPARHVIIFWPDLFGIAEPYNLPGEVSPDNWSLRVPPDFEAALTRAVASGAAPSLPRALAWALHARGLAEGDEGSALAERLEAATPTGPAT
jgi:4-alpha-glucanotransferase